MTQEPERNFPFVEVLIEGTNQVIRFYRDGNSDEGTYHISKEALLDVLFNQFKWGTPQYCELSDEKIIDLCIKEVQELIAPAEPDYDPSQWNQTIERAILRILNVKVKLKHYREIKKASEK